jgi:membrane peptidoglycan carboxypeptidase
MYRVVVATPAHSRRRSLLRILRRVVVALAGIVVLLALASAIYLFTLPGVGDAPSRVRTILAQHHESTAALPAPRRLVAAVVSTEDEHFYNNVVINMLSGAGRAALATLQAEGDPGGSTIDGGGGHAGRASPGSERL